MEKAEKDLIENYTLSQLQLLAKYYQLSDNQSLNGLLDAIAESNLSRQRATMLPYAGPIHEALVRGMSFNEAVNLCNTDKNFATLCREPLVWKTWAESHPQERNEALLKAVRNNKPVVAKGLIAGGVDPTMKDNIAIRLASDYGYLEMVKLLLADPKVDPGANNNEAIRYASIGGHTDVVKLLLADSRVDPTVYGNTVSAIGLASDNGQIDVVKLLLADPRIDPAADDNWAIRYASRNGHADIVKLLLADDRVDPAANDNWALQKAMWKDHTDVIKLLLADPRVKEDSSFKYLKVEAIKAIEQ